MSCTLAVTPLSLSAAFAAGIASSVHCLAMCGGIANALALKVKLDATANASHSAMALNGLTHQLGRIIGYGVLGGIGGALGGALSAALSGWHVPQLFRLIAAALIIALGFQLVLGRPMLRAIERAGAGLWRRLAPWVGRIDRQGVYGALLIGMMWAMMPCGLIYSMLAIAALSASPLTGAAMMVAFGAGTLPAVFGGSLLISSASTRLFGRRTPARAAGALLLTFGIWTAYSTLM